MSRGDSRAQFIEPLEGRDLLSIWPDGGLLDVPAIVQNATISASANSASLSTTAGPRLLDSAKLRHSGAIKIVGRSNVVIENLFITARGQDCAIELVDCPGAIVRNCVIRGKCRTAMQLESCDHIQVKGNRIEAGFENRTDKNGDENEGHGIQFRKCDRVVVVNNVVRRTRSGEDGINFFGTRHFYCRGNTVTGHGTSKSGNGITVDKGCKRGKIIGNTVDSTGGYGGITIAWGFGYQVLANTLRNCSGNGIAFDPEPYRATIRRVIVRGNAFARCAHRLYLQPKHVLDVATDTSVESP